MVAEIIDYIFGVIWIIMMTLQIGNLGSMVLMSCLDQGCVCCLSDLVVI